MTMEDKIEEQRRISADPVLRAERKRKFQESIKKMVSTPAHPDAGKPIDMMPYLKEHPDSAKLFLPIRNAHGHPHSEDPTHPGKK